MARAVVTGIGCVTPLGQGVAETWHDLCAGLSGVGPITLFDPSGMECRIAAEVKGWDPLRWMEAKTARRASRFAQFAIAAARQAVEEAALPINNSNRDDIAVVMNTGGGGLSEVAQEERTRLQKGPRRVSPLLVPMLAPNMASCQVAMQFAIRGPVITSVAACAAGVYSFIEAKRLLDLGEAQAVVVGGAEAGIVPVVLASLSQAGALSARNEEPQRASRPFDLHRDGFVFGEGAVAMVVERAEHALARGAPIYAELAGGALTCDAYHITAPEPSGEAAALAMSRALKACALSPEKVDYIVAHGTGTPLNDMAETQAIKQALGEHAYRVAISSPKSMVGHLLGAAGALSALAAVLAIRDGVIPPTINLETPDPQCDLDYVPLVARRSPVRVALANGFGFGGQNASVAFRQFDGTTRAAR